MRRYILTVAASTIAVVGPAAQQPDPVKAASDAIGAGSLTSLSFTALGANFSVGQSPNPKEPWPRVTIKKYTAALNYDTGAMRVELIREQGPVPPRGGGQPFTGEQRVRQLINGNDAWNVTLTPPPRPGPGAPPISPVQAGIDPVPWTEQAPQAQPAAAAERMLQIWMTPHGFLKQAAKNDATSKRVANGTEVSFTMGGKYRVSGLIDSKNQVERVQTWIDSPVLGDMLVETIYRDYERADGDIFVPMHIVQSQGGFPSLELWLHGVQANPTVQIETPDAVRTATPPPVRVDAQKVADGVYYLTGGSHHSVAVEMADHVVLVEAPLNEERSLAVVAKVKEAIPNKAIRYVINTHAHFDHAGGLRTLVDEGATIVTHEMNRPFYEAAWAAPRTINPDRLARSKKPATFQTFTDKLVLGDAARGVEIYRIVNSPHNDAFAMVYLPASRILIEADAYTPGAVPPAPAAGATPPAPTGMPPGPPPTFSQTTINLYENIQRLKLDVAQIAALHGPRLATMEDLARAIGRAEPN